MAVFALDMLLSFRTAYAEGENVVGWKACSGMHFLHGITRACGRGARVCVREGLGLGCWRKCGAGGRVFAKRNVHTLAHVRAGETFKLPGKAVGGRGAL